MLLDSARKPAQCTEIYLVQPRVGSGSGSGTSAPMRPYYSQNQQSARKCLSKLYVSGEGVRIGPLQPCPPTGLNFAKGPKGAKHRDPPVSNGTLLPFSSAAGGRPKRGPKHHRTESSDGIDDHFFYGASRSHTPAPAYLHVFLPACITGRGLCAWS